MKTTGKLVFMLAASVFSSAFAGTIYWEDPLNISGSSSASCANDVRTAGTLCYAYAQKGATVNGVQFVNGLQQSKAATIHIPNSTVNNIEIAASGGGQMLNTEQSSVNVPKDGDFVKGFTYNDKNTSATVTLRNLTPGRRYLVQFWGHDNRSGCYTRTEKVDGVKTLKYCTGNDNNYSSKYGQHITGWFTADAATQSFTLSDSASAQINAIQVRDVSSMAWEAANDISGDGDVRNEGTTLYAYNPYAAVTVNGVAFDNTIPIPSSDIGFSLSMSDAGTVNLASAPNDIARRFLYKGNNVLTVTLKNLTAGNRYLVQFWVNDDRNDGVKQRYVLVDGGRVVKYFNGTYGQYVTGEFTAAASTWSFTLTPLAMSGNPDVQVNAIQVRDLGVPSAAVQTWSGAAGTSLSWSGQNWDSNANSWTDGNDAVFATDGAIADVDSAVIAGTVTFNDNATVTGDYSLSVSEIEVAANKTATISAPVSAFEKTGAGTLEMSGDRTSQPTLSDGTLRKTGGTWTISGFALGDESAETTFVNAGGDMALTGWATIGGNTAGAGTSTMVVNGGSVSRTDNKDTVIGARAGGVLVVTNNAAYTDSNNIYAGFQNGSSGTLEVSDGGTVTAGHLAFGCTDNDSGSGTGAVNLGIGGTLAVGDVAVNKIASAALAFNGGTLKATADSATFIPAANVLSVTAGANGGTIDANGHAVTVKAAISGVGGMTFKGGGSVAFEGSNTYVGGTVVELGTVLKFPSVADIPGSVTVVVPAPAAADGVYKVLVLTGGGTFDGVPAGITVPEGGRLIVTDDGKTVSCVYGDAPGFVWIGGAEGSLGEAANWACNAVPGAGDSCFIGNIDGATLTVDGAFAPASITFLADSAAVTIGGAGTISGIAAITNHSAVAHVFNCAVSGTAIDFHNATTRCEFWGGVTVGSATFSGPNNKYAKGIAGIWRFTDGWTPVAYNEIGQAAASGQALASGSSVTVAGELLNPNNIVIKEGCVVTAATMRATNSSFSYVAYENSGRLVINGTIDISTSADYALARTSKAADYKNDYTADHNSTIIAGGIEFNTTSWKTLNAKTLVVGEDGIKCTSKSYHLNFNGAPTLYAKDAELTIYGAKDDNTIYTIANDKTLTICTTRFESSPAAPATITIDGRFRKGWLNSLEYQYTNGVMAVTGCGKVVFNSVSDFTGGLAIGDTATVAVNAGCTPGHGTVTVGATATLEVPASETVTLAGDLTLDDGATLAFNFTDRRIAPQLAIADGKTVTANGAVKVKITADCDWPTSGMSVLTSGADFTGVPVALDADAPKWAKGGLSVVDGNIVLYVKPKGTVVIFR